MKKSLLLMAALSTNCFAANLFVGGWSSHLSGGDYNETHNLIAVECKSIVIGRFDNSFNDNTVFAGKKFYQETEYFEYGLIGGVMYGYDREDSPLFNFNGFQPMIVPYVTIGDYAARPTILLLGSAVAITFRIDL